MLMMAGYKGSTITLRSEYGEGWSGSPGSPELKVLLDTDGESGRMCSLDSAQVPPILKAFSRPIIEYSDPFSITSDHDGWRTEFRIV
jgi:hypothetical protein